MPFIFLTNLPKIACKTPKNQVGTFLIFHFYKKSHFMTVNYAPQKAHLDPIKKLTHIKCFLELSCSYAQHSSLYTSLLDTGCIPDKYNGYAK